MKKSWKIAWVTLKNEKLITKWSVFLSVFSFTLSSGYFFIAYGKTKLMEHIMDTLFLLLIPILTGYLATLIYHYLRSDLYQDLDKQDLNTQMIFGNLITLVEHWKPEGQNNWLPTKSIESYRKLKQYRKAYNHDMIHPKIDQFLSYFSVQDDVFNYEVKTKFSNQSEANNALPVLKQLAREIGREIRA